jgi:hypothetical protein
VLAFKPLGGGDRRLNNPAFARPRRAAQQLRGEIMTEKLAPLTEILDVEQFEPVALFQLIELARNFLRNADDPWSAYGWVELWMNLDSTLQGDGFDFADPDEDIASLVNPEMIERAKVEGEVLKMRKDSGRCVHCGGTREHDHNHNHEAANAAAN